jgi:hypothetical protein
MVNFNYYDAIGKKNFILIQELNVKKIEKVLFKKNHNLFNYLTFFILGGIQTKLPFKNIRPNSIWQTNEFLILYQQTVFLIDVFS